MTDDDGREMKLVDAPPDLPSGLLLKACQELHQGHSPFTMVMAIGCYKLVDPRTGTQYPQIAVASHLRKDMPEELARLADKLRQVVADLDAILATQGQPAS
jgi:hypothetical protein